MEGWDGRLGADSRLHGPVSRKTLVSRSFSAPQAQNRMVSSRSAHKSRNGLHLQSSTDKWPTDSAYEQNITTLSDSLVPVSIEEVVQTSTTNLSSQSSSCAHCVPAQVCDHCPTALPLYHQDDRNNSTNSCIISKDNIDDFITEPDDSSGRDSHSGGRDSHSGGTDSCQEAINGEEREHLPSNLDIDWNDVELRNKQNSLQHSQPLSLSFHFQKIKRRMTLDEVKEKGYTKLQDELAKMQKALEMKAEEVDELRGIRERLMKEVSDFTASLFEEVNSQLNEAALSEQLARKQLHEANTKIEMLSAEVAALKALVLTSTPSSPNRHLHPQIDNSTKKSKGSRPFWKTHRRSTSHHQLTQESKEMAEASEHHSLLIELDTVAFDEFQRWHLQPSLDSNGQFFARIQQEDIFPCLNFKNAKLACQLLEGVKSNTLSIEPIPGDHSFPRKCCLSESHKLCNYKIRFEADEHWYSISQMSRNRIAAVCDFYSYIRYIVQGLVKCSEKDMFAEIVRLRNQMAQARLGLI